MRNLTTLRCIMHNLLLGGFIRTQLTRDATFAHHNDAMAHPQDFRQFRGNHNNRFALLDQIIEQFVDFTFCTHINATCRLIKNEDVRIRRKPFANDDLLLIATGEVFDLLLQPRRLNR